jgi:hypothetical protein
LQSPLSLVDQVERKPCITWIGNCFAARNGTDDAAPLLGRETPPLPSPLVAAELQLS